MNPASGVFACAANLVRGFFDREPGIQWMIERDIADVPATVLAAGQQAGDDMVKQHGLSDAPRYHEDHGAVHARLLHEMREALEQALGEFDRVHSQRFETKLREHFTGGEGFCISVIIRPFKS